MENTKNSVWLKQKDIVAIMRGWAETKRGFLQQMQLAQTRSSLSNTCRLQMAFTQKGGGGPP